MTLRFHIKTALAQRMFEDMQLRNFSPHTIVAYLRCVSQFAQHFNTSPDRLGPEHTRAYQQFLMQDKKVAWSTYIVAVCALRFFYDKTLHRPAMVEYMPFPKRPKTLPVILSRQEVATLLLAPSNLKHRVILATLYATGVRVAELCNLQGRDIDSGRMVIQVRQGKGQRDRQVMLSHELLPLLRYYWKRYQLDAWLFPGPTRTKHALHRGDDLAVGRLDLLGREHLALAQAGKGVGGDGLAIGRKGEGPRAVGPGDVAFQIGEGPLAQGAVVLAQPRGAADADVADRGRDGHPAGRGNQAGDEAWASLTSGCLL